MRLIWRGWKHGYPAPQYLHWRFWRIQRWSFGGSQYLGCGPVVVVVRLLQTCQWCRKLIWIRSRDRMHLRCAEAVDRIYLQGQEVTGI